MWDDGWWTERATRRPPAPSAQRSEATRSAEWPSRLERPSSSRTARGQPTSATPTLARRRSPLESTAAAGEAAANPRVSDGSKGELREEEVDEGGAVGVGDAAEAEGGGEAHRSRGVSSSGSTLSCGTTATEPRGSAPTATPSTVTPPDASRPEEP